MNTKCLQTTMNHLQRKVETGSVNGSFGSLEKQAMNLKVKVQNNMERLPSLAILQVNCVESTLTPLNSKTEIDLVKSVILDLNHILGLLADYNHRSIFITKILITLSNDNISEDELKIEFSTWMEALPDIPIIFINDIYLNIIRNNKWKNIPDVIKEINLKTNELSLKIKTLNKLVEDSENELKTKNESISYKDMQSSYKKAAANGNSFAKLLLKVNS